MCYLTENKIRDKALTLFVEKGYSGTSLSDIGNEVGIKKQSIYTHFKSKDDLFLQVMNRVLDVEVDSLNNYFKEKQHAPLFEKLYGFITLFRKRYMLESEENVKFLLRMMFIPPNHIQDTVIKKVLSYYNLLENHVEAVFLENEKILDVEPLEAKLAFLNLFDGLLVELVYVNVDSFEKRLNASWDVFCKGVRKENI
ncbi:TetR/AcrR family transcriptional regulator [Pseudogracilibacillus sp. SO30301A]|uniref:TetR/AcrR family transcriptional regulator n=1 Tax=Pseudogracilibacillus sp. SO30301A TaxID=3098291 RepID=UPI00300DC91C